MAFTAIRRRKQAEFLTKTDRTKYRNTQNILLDVCYPLFEEYVQEKTSVYLLKPFCEIDQSFKEGLRGGKLIKNLFRNILNE